jgi:hypothetical protein
VTDSEDNRQRQRLGWLGFTLLGYLVIVGMVVVCITGVIIYGVYNCAMGIGSSAGSVVAKFSDRWELKNGHAIYKAWYLDHLHRRGEWEVALERVDAYDKQGTLVFFLTRDSHYAVLDLTTNSLQEFDRLEDAPPAWRGPLGKLKRP